MERSKRLIGDGKDKIKTSYEEERRIREDIGRKFAKKFGIKLD